MSRAREHLRSNIIGYVALFIALAGTAYALPGKNTVDSGDIRNGQVKTADIRNDNVRADPDIEAGRGDIGTGPSATASLTGVTTSTRTDSSPARTSSQSSLDGVNARSAGRARGRLRLQHAPHRERLPRT